METVSFFRKLGLLLGLAAVQVLFLNRISLFGYVTPLLYIWMILRFDSSMSRTGILLWSFFLGLTVDIFSATPGLNAASATLLGMVQPGLVKLFATHDRHDVLLPGVQSMGPRQFAGYLILATLIHHSVYFLLRSIPLGDWSVLVAKVVFSALLTFVFMLVFGISSSKNAAARRS